MRYWISGCGRVELAMRDADVLACSHSGSCDADVARVADEPYMMAQLVALDFEQVKAVLREYGAWEEWELDMVRESQERLVWIAACDLREDAEAAARGGAAMSQDEEP